MPIELHPSLNIVAGGGILCSPSSVTSDYHSSTASTITNNSSLNYPHPKSSQLARSSASLATVYKSPHPPPVPPKPRSKQQRVASAESNHPGVTQPSANSVAEESVVTAEETEEPEDRLSVTEGDVREAEADLRPIDCGMAFMVEAFANRKGCIDCCIKASFQPCHSSFQSFEVLNTPSNVL